MNIFSRSVWLAVIVFSTLSLSSRPADAHDDDSYNNDNAPDVFFPEWMTPLPDELKLSELSIPGTHDSGSYVLGSAAVETQRWTIGDQLLAGIRVFDLRIGQTPACPLHIFHNFVCQGLSWQDVVDELVAFLTAHPGETIIARVKKEYGDPSFDAVKTALGSHYYDAVAYSEGVIHNPTLGALRGKIYVLADSWGDRIGPNAWGDLSATTQDQFSMPSTWAMAVKWNYVRSHFVKTDNPRDPAEREKIYINFLSAAVGATPRFFASGHGAGGTDEPRFLTAYTRGLIDTCALDKDLCIDEYPSVNCVDFFGVAGSETCSVAYEGINTMARDYILSNIVDRAGLVMIDFPGSGLIKSIIELNPWREPLIADAGGSYGEEYYKQLEGLDIAYLWPGPNMTGAAEWRWDTNGDGVWDTPYMYNKYWQVPATDDDYYGRVCIEARSSVGITDTDCNWLRFLNLRPDFLNFSVTEVTVEGYPAKVEGLVIDPGLDSHEYDIDWDGDGFWDSQVSLPVSATPCPSPYEEYYCKPFSTEYIYPDNGPPGANYDHDFAIELRDDDDGTIRHELKIKVWNSKPSIDLAFVTNGDSGVELVENEVIPSGTLVNINVFFSDAGVNDTHGARIDWGDGTETFLTDVVDELSTGHTYTTAGARQITATVNDNNGDATAYQSPIFFVQDPPPPPDTTPVANAGGPYSVFEGFFVNADASASTVHPGRTAWYRWDFDNNGTWDTPRTTKPVSPSWFGPNPDFPDDYSGQLKVEVWDGSQAATALANVAFVNAYPTAFSTFSDNSINEGESVVLTVVIDDPGYDDYTIDIDWDGDTVYDETVVLPPGSKKASVSHTFLNNPAKDDPNNPDPASEILTGIRVADDDGDVGFDQPNIDVYNLAPSVSLNLVFIAPFQTLGPVPAWHRDTVPTHTEIQLKGYVSDPGAEDPLTVTVDWDDGDSDVVTVDEFGYFNATHQYSQLGIKEISVLAVDDDGAEETDTWPLFEVIDWVFGDGFESE